MVFFQENPISLIFPAVLIATIFSDLFSMRIPNRFSLVLILGFIFFAGLTAMPFEAIAWHAAAFILTLLIGFSLFAAGWVGGGDVKLASAAALWLGLELLPAFALYFSVFGLLLTIAILMVRQMPLPVQLHGVGWVVRLHDRKTGVPYGIALAAAGLLLFPQVMS